jgi:hypothetical protein
MQELSIDWEVPLAKVKQLVEQHLQQGGTHIEYSNTYTWQGRRLSLSLDVAPAEDASEDSSAAAKLKIGCYVELKARGLELCQLTFGMWLLRAGSTTAEGAVVKSNITGYMRGKQGWGSTEFVYSGAASSWQQVERALREQQAVHADGCLQLRAVVEKLE